MGAYSKVWAYLPEIPQGVGAYSKGGLLEGGGLIGVFTVTVIITLPYLPNTLNWFSR